MKILLFYNYSANYFIGNNKSLKDYELTYRYKHIHTHTALDSSLTVKLEGPGKKMQSVEYDYLFTWNPVGIILTEDPLLIKMAICFEISMQNTPYSLHPDSSSVLINNILWLSVFWKGELAGEWEQNGD